MFGVVLRTSVVLAGLIGGIAVPAQAQEPTPGHLAAARELMEVTGVLSPVSQLIPTFSEQVRRQSLTRPEMTKDLDEVLKTLDPEMQLQRQQVTNVVSRTYAKWLSEAELKQVAAFFRTPIGAKFNKVQPELVDDVVNDVQVWTRQASEYLIVRVRAEMAKRGHQMQ